MIDKWFSMSDSQRLAFIERSVVIHDSKGNTFPLSLASFQKDWLLAGPLFSDFRYLKTFRNRITLKCRNVGASYIMIALESVLTAWLYPKITIPFVAPSEDQTKNLISSCMSLIGDVRFDLELKGGIKNQTKGEINFLNGSKIKAFSSNPKSLRGTRALCVYIDELSSVEHDQAIYDAVNYFLTEGGQLNVLSTPWGKQNLYWRIWSDRKGYADWDRFDIKPFSGDLDINRSISEQLASGKIKLLIPWLNVTKVENDRKADSHNNYRNFMQEMLGIPLEEVSSVISTDLLNTVTKSEYNIEYRVDDSQVFSAGVDYGASNNMTAAVTGVFEDGRLVVCNTSQFSGNVDIQIDSLVEYTNRYKHDYYFGDSTGLGGVAFQDVLGSRDTKVGMIVGVDYSKKDIASNFGSNMNNKEYMVNRALELFARGKIIVPDNFRELRLQILGVKKYVYEKHIKYSGKDSLTKNDDLAMAFFQLVLSFDYHFGLGDIETVSASKSDWFNRDSKPKMVKAIYHEGSSSKTVLVDRGKRGRGVFSSYV